MQCHKVTDHHVAVLVRDVMKEEKVKKRKKKQDEIPAQTFSKVYDLVVHVRRQGLNNMVLSTLSVEFVLALMLKAVGSRQVEEINAFFEERRIRNVVQEHFDAVMAGKSKPNNIATVFCNKIFTDSNFHIERKFKNLASRVYFTDIDSFDFLRHPRQSVKDVNDWVNTENPGIFSSLMTEDDISRETKVIFANLIYFKGKWKYRFYSEKIQKRPFFLSTTRFKDVEMMTNKEYYGYKNMRDINARMLVMPYAGDKFSLVIILPNEIDGIYDVEEKMSKANLMKELQSVTHPEVEVFLPRFKIDSKFDLTNDLKSLGIVSVFDPISCDLSGLIKAKGLCLSSVVQKAIIEVTEESNPMVENILAAPKRISTSKQRIFIVDHPFLFYVVNTEWQSVLMIGRYKMPDNGGPSASNFSARS